MEENYLLSLSIDFGRKTPKNKIIHLRNYNKIPFSKARKLAIENLRRTVLDKDLTLGDKKIIKNIALETFQANLERSQDPKITEIWNYTGCVRTDMSEWARDKLISYGFKYFHPYFEDINLR